MALMLPSWKGIRTSSAKEARSSFIFFAVAVPPVMPEIMMG